MHDLKHNIEHYNEALYQIIDMEKDESADELQKKDMDIQILIKQEAQKLYGLIHQRFIESPFGLDLMVSLKFYFQLKQKSKMMKGDFGFCPRVLCEKQPVIPWGESDKPDISQTRVFCPKCKGLF